MASQKPKYGMEADLPQTSGAQTGKGLKPGLNDAQTGSVVHQVKGQVRLGRQMVSGNAASRNSMVSANGSRKR